LNNESCSVKTFVDGGRFEVVSGSEYVVNGDVMFPDDPNYLGYFDNGRMSKNYRTYFGLRFFSSAVVTMSNNDGLRGAVRRLTCAREPDIPGVHQQLKDDQYRNLTLTSPGIAAWVLWFNARLGEVLRGGIGDSTELRNAWTLAPHVKRKLRIRTMVELNQSGCTTGTRIKRVRVKAKPGEFLDRGKYLRAVGDCTAPGTSVFAYFMDFVKYAFSIPYRYKTGVSVFVKPSAENMAKAFDMLIAPKDQLSFIFLSDDSCLSIVCSDGIFRCNMDVKVCDGSHYDPIFEVFRAAIDTNDSRFTNDISNFFAQCLSKCVIFSTQWLKVLLRPLFHTLYSGHAATTNLNNTANTMIFIQIADALEVHGSVTKSQCAALITNAAAKIGYLVRIDQCDHIQQLQFLKHSPTADGGFFLNLGVILRSHGSCDGELPGRGEIKARSYNYQASVIDGYVHSGDSSIMRNLRARYPTKPSTKIIIKNDEQWRVKRSSESFVSDNDLCLRYQISQCDLDELNIYTGEGKDGDIIRCAALDKIFKVDYGYDGVDL